jgi:protein-export membrane protein SecD
MSEQSGSGCLTSIVMMIAAIFGTFMAAFSSSSSTLVDLSNSTEIVTHVSLAPVGTFTPDELQQAKEVITKRLEGLGLSAATVEVVDDKTISVGLPQVEDINDVVQTISTRGLLEFVDFSDVPDYAQWTGQAILTTGQGDHPISTTSTVNPTTNKPFETVLTGTDILSVSAELNQQFSQWQVNITFSDEAGKILGDYTRAHIGKPLGIVLDGKPVSIPIVQSEISTQVVIQGNFTEQETKRLAVQLGGGVLPFEMQAQVVRVGIIRGDYGVSFGTATPTANP